jgi:hypothetical protein
MRLRWQSGLVVDTARMGATALSGNGPVQLIFRNTVDELTGCFVSALHNYALPMLMSKRKFWDAHRTSQ